MYVRFRYSGKKSDAVCGFLEYFFAVLRFSEPPYSLSIKCNQICKFLNCLSLRLTKVKLHEYEISRYMLRLKFIPGRVYGKVK